jgi:metal-dependent hydrolase (beta-lactamase superfamily II)
MLLIEDEEIVLFSGCSNSEIISILEDVKLFSRSLKIKATIGGSNIHNPGGNKTQTMSTGQVFEL